MPILWRAIGIVVASLCGGTTYAAAQQGAWHDIDCSQSDIVLEHYTKCRQQTPYGGPDARGEYHHQTATFRSSTESIYVFLQKPRITLYGAAIKMDPAIRENALAHPVTSMEKASNFSSTIRLPNGYAKTFSFSPDWKCFSFNKDAPLQGMGIAYYITGYSCGKGPEAQSPDKMAAFLSKLDVKY